MGSPAKTLIMKTSMTPGNFIKCRICLMLNTLPDCDVPTEDNIQINTQFIQVRSRMRGTLGLPAQVHHHLCKKASLWSTSFLLMAEGWELVLALHEEDPCETAGSLPTLGQLSPAKGPHSPFLRCKAGTELGACDSARQSC